MAQLGFYHLTRTGLEAALPALLARTLAAGARAVVRGSARFLFLVDGATADLARFERVFDLFDGNDPDAVAAARARWKTARAEGHALTYWQQGESGWIRQAEVAPETPR
ncbi:MAG: hypothetical protein B7Z59_11010 [Acidiphilium sp. 37-67-22]|nr:MAG: hypothetical protein B7Z59_11010 [Acidiphilium sp. 37-67-22]